jgi:ligand-binding sensor domain-containing protein
MLWIVSNGLDRLDPKTGTFIHYPHDPLNPNSISSNFVDQCAEDKYGNLWISTYQGLNKLNKERTKFTTYVHVAGNPATLSSDEIPILLIDKSGTLWTGTWGKGIDKTSLKAEKFRLYRHNPFNANSITDKSSYGYFRR